MKKWMVAFVLVVAASVANAQEIGFRFGDVTGGNFALDAVFGLGELSRIHADASFGGGGLGVDALWDFVYLPIDKGGLNWYAGFGPGVYLGNTFGFYGLGELGIEYRFSEAPVSLSVDWRPRLAFTNNAGAYFGGYGLNIRYILK